MGVRQNKGLFFGALLGSSIFLLPMAYYGPIIVFKLLSSAHFNNQKWIFLLLQMFLLWFIPFAVGYEFLKIKYAHKHPDYFRGWGIIDCWYEADEVIRGSLVDKVLWALFFCIAAAGALGMVFGIGFWLAPAGSGGHSVIFAGLTYLGGWAVAFLLLYWARIILPRIFLAMFLAGFVWCAKRKT